MIAHLVTRFARTLVLATLALATLQAQESGFYKDVKIRTAYAFQTKDNLRASSLGFGLTLGYQTPETKCGIELGYYYKAGDQFMVGPAGTVPDGLTAIDHDRFGDSRRNSLDGFAVRLSYQRNLNEDWAWQVGAMLGGTRFKHEYVGQAQSLGWSTANTSTEEGGPIQDPNSWLDTWNGTPVKGGISVSPYVGLSWKMSAVSSIEVNVMLLSYKSLNYVHHVGSGTYEAATDAVPGSDEAVGRISPNNGFPGDVLESSNRMVPHIEVGYVFHF